MQLSLSLQSLPLAPADSWGVAGGSAGVAGTQGTALDQLAETTSDSSPSSSLGSGHPGLLSAQGQCWWFSALSRHLPAKLPQSPSSLAQMSPFP